MPKKEINLLVIEDDEIDRLAFNRASGKFHIPIKSKIVASLSEIRELEDLSDFDVIFTDYYLDDGTAQDVIEIAGSIPVLVATGTNEIQIAVNVLKLGAFDFLVKDIERNYLSVLPYTVEKALEKKSALENERILSSVVTSIKDMVLIIDKKNTIQFANPSFSEAYGYSQIEIVGMPAEIIIPAADRSSRKYFEIEDKHVDQLHVRKDGSTFFVSVTISALTDEKGQILSKIIVCRDVSERLQMLNQIHKNQKQLRIIFDNSAVGIGMFDMSGKLVQLNTILCDFTGYSEDELHRLNIKDLYHPDDRRIDKNNYDKLLNGEIESYNAEKRLTQKSGEILWLKLTISMVSEESDGQSYVIVIFENITERKKIEEALVASEVRVDGIMSSLKDVVYSVNPESMEIYYVNKAVEEVFELSASEFRSDQSKWVKLVHGGDFIKLDLAQQQLLKDGKSEVEYRVILPSGNLKWVRDRSWIVFDDNHSILRIDGIITDISKRKMAEQAHRDSEERYRTAIQSSLEAIYMLNPLTGLVLDANEAFCNLMGYTHAETSKLTIYDFIKGTKNEIDSLITRIVDDGGGQLGERIWLKKDGSEIFMQVNASRIRQRDQEILFVVARDVTEEKQFKEKIEQERKLLKEVVSSAPIPMALLDEELKFVVYSKSWRLAYGPSRAEILNENLFDVYKMLPQSWIDLCIRGVKGEILAIPEEELTLPNGQKIYLRLAIHPWGDTERNRAGIVLVAERIDELVSARKSAEDANQAKSAFLARITHELRTPLNAILGFSQILIKDSTLDTTHKSYIESMYRSGMHLLNMINDILDLSKIEASRMDLQNESMDLRELLRDLVGMFKMKCQSKGIGLKFEIDEIIHPFILADRSKLNQVLINLLGNAVKFTEKGEVGIKVNCKSIAKDKRTQYLEFIVSDTGIGIPVEDLESVFEPFHQAKNSVSQGTGLGLSITKKIVSLMDGQINVRSKIGLGSEFMVEIGFEMMDSISESHYSEYNNVIGLDSPSTYKILVADDVEQNRTVVRLLLNRIGIEVFEATNGKEAVEYFEKIQPDFVIMDIIMPVMDGVKAMVAIKKMDAGKQIPVIALTASGFDDKRDRLIEAGFDDYILKPFTESELLESISKLGGVKYRHEDSSNNLTSTGVEYNLLSAQKEWAELLPEVQDELVHFLEVQEFESINEYLQKPEIEKSSPNLYYILSKAIAEFDFYILDQLLKNVRTDS